MTIQTAVKNIRLHILKDTAARTATIKVNQRTPVGWEEIDREEVGLDTLREVLTEWYDIPAANMRGV